MDLKSIYLLNILSNYCIGFLKASRMYTTPFEGPGTGPLTKTNPRSRSTLTTWTLGVVTFLAPICPAIFFPGKTLPGSFFRQYTWFCKGKHLRPSRRPGRSVSDRYAVGSRQTVKSMSFHDTCKPFSFPGIINKLQHKLYPLPRISTN